MVKIHKASEVESMGRAGYDVKYVAHLTFKDALDNGMFIYVKIPAGMKTRPHRHNILEEVFIAIDSLTIGVNDIPYSLEEGDVVLVEPGESHWFRSPEDRSARMIAIKLPNIEDDKEETS